MGDKMTKIPVGKRSDIPEGSMKQVKADNGTAIVVANVNGKLYAIRGICNHAGGPLGNGKLEGNIVTCPWHGSKWDVTTGKCVQFQMELNPEPVYKIVEENGSVYVEA